MSARRLRHAILHCSVMFVSGGDSAVDLPDLWRRRIRRTEVDLTAAECNQTQFIHICGHGNNQPSKPKTLSPHACNTQASGGPSGWKPLLVPPFPPQLHRLAHRRIQAWQWVKSERTASCGYNKHQAGEFLETQFHAGASYNLAVRVLAAVCVPSKPKLPLSPCSDRNAFYGRRSYTHSLAHHLCHLCLAAASLSFSGHEGSWSTTAPCRRIFPDAPTYVLSWKLPCVTSSQAPALQDSAQSLRMVVPGHFSAHLLRRTRLDGFRLARWRRLR